MDAINSRAITAIQTKTAKTKDCPLYSHGKIYSQTVDQCTEKRNDHITVAHIFNGPVECNVKMKQQLQKVMSNKNSNNNNEHKKKIDLVPIHRSKCEARKQFHFVTVCIAYLSYGLLNQIYLARNSIAILCA